MRLALLAILASAAASAPGAAAAPPPALAAVAEGLAAEVGPPIEERGAILLAVEAHAPLRAPLEACLEAALAARGYAVSLHRGGGDAEASARAASQDWLLRVQGGLVPGRRELAAVGELIPTWASFFLQRRPGARPLPPRIVRARAPADPETLFLGRGPRPPGAPFASVRPLARVEGRVVALAVGDAGGGEPAAIAAWGPGGLRILSAAGAPVAELALEAPRGVRDPAAALAVGDFGDGRIALMRAGAAHGEVLALRRGLLEPAGELAAPPLCAGEAGVVLGAFQPGTGLLRDEIALPGGAAARSGRPLYAVACAPGGGPIAFAALGTDLRLDLLGPDLRPVELSAGALATIETGTGFALADLDGDGAAELVASSPDPAAPERIRVFAPLAERPLLLESPPVEGAILAGAAGDLTGDGVDDAVLAAVVEGGGDPFTQLLLVTSDPREGT